MTENSEKSNESIIQPRGDQIVKPDEFDDPKNLMANQNSRFPERKEVETPFKDDQSALVGPVQFRAK